MYFKSVTMFDVGNYWTDLKIRWELYFERN
jgi:hypothetical protein